MFLHDLDLKVQLNVNATEAARQQPFEFQVINTLVTVGQKTLAAEQVYSVFTVHAMVDCAHGALQHKIKRKK